MEVPQLLFSDKVADMPVVVLKTLLKPVETPQVQYLDKVFLQFIDQVVDISVVAQRPFPMVPVFPKTTEVPQLQDIDKEVDVAVLQVVQVHDGAPMDTKRAKMAGQTLEVQGVLAEVRGGWKFMKDTFGSSGWNTNSGICWLCDCTPQTLRHVGYDAPWRVNRRSHWDLLAHVTHGGRDLPLFGEHCGPVVSGSIGCIALTKVWLRTSWAVSSFTSSKGPTCLERTDENGASLSGSESKVFTVNVR